MTTLIIAIHILVCFLLVTIILIQRGRGGGLVESFSGVESMFGTKTNVVLTRTTTVLSVLFFLTCLSLTFLSVRQSRSLMPDTRAPIKATEETLPLPAAPQQLPKAEEKTTAAQTQESAKTE